MSRPLRVPAFALLVVTAFFASAQDSGAPFALTNSRYGVANGSGPMLRSNGRDAVLFSTCCEAQGLRATKIVDGEDRPGNQIFDVGDWPFDSAWTGTHFLAVAQVRVPSATIGELDPATRLVGRRVDYAGRPTGEQFTIVTNALHPQLAAGHGVALLVYTTAAKPQEVYALLLNADGTHAGEPTRLQRRGAVVATASGFAIVFGDPSRVMATMLDRRGHFIGDREIAATAGVTNVAAAAHGDTLLAVWQKDGEAGVARAVDGAPGAPLIIHTSGVSKWGSTPSAAWNGAGWTVLYHTVEADQYSRVRVAHIDPNVTQVVGREEAPPRTNTPSIAVLGTRTIVAWANLDGWIGTASVSNLPLAQNTPRVASLGATEQALLATASSANATFFAWIERGGPTGSVHVGVRTHDGQWRERQLTGVSHPYYEASAASDGENFVLAVDRKAFRFDAAATLLGEPLALPAVVRFIAWSGAKYVLFTSHHGPSAYTLMPSGELSGAIGLPISFVPTSAALNENGFILAGSTTCANPCSLIGTRATRLTSELARVDAQDMVFEDGELPYGVAWDGEEYAIAWNVGNETRIARVPASGDATPRVQQVMTQLQSDYPPIAIAAMSEGTVAILGRKDNAFVLTFIRRNGSVIGSQNLFESVEHWQRHGVHPLADGAIAHVAARQSDRAPHHTAPRLVMTTITPGKQPPTPSAPQLRVRNEGDQVQLDWTAPAGTVNGYRVERRVDDGAWTEIERWFDPGETIASIPVASRGTTLAFRVRGFNDAGAGEYSNVVQTPRRRRTVR